MSAFAKKRMNVCHEDRRRQGDNLAPLRSCEEERTFTRRHSPEEILKKKIVPKSLLRTGVFFRFAAAPETRVFSVGRQQT